MLWWIFFHILVFIVLALDLLVFNKKPHEVSFKEAIGWTTFWVFLALMFNAGIYFFMGSDLAAQFLSSYLLEKSLSVDNLFVFMLIFTTFNVDAKYQHKLLFWGIIGAIVMRAVFILGGMALVQQFHWILYLFGALLVYTSIKMLFSKDEDDEDIREGRLYKTIVRFLPIDSNAPNNGSFFIKDSGGFIRGTPLLLVLFIIEFSDVLFATDSIPAVLSVTNNNFIAYTSNIFAILGLRAMYFAVSSLMRYFKYLEYGVIAVLLFIGLKMLLMSFIHVSITFSLGFIVAALTTSIVASVIKKE